MNKTNKANKMKKKNKDFKRSLDSNLIIRVPSDLRNKVREAAKLKGMTTSSFIRSLLLTALMKNGLI